jgi:hypothetical protein
MGSNSTFHLAFGYIVRMLNAGKKDPGSAKNFEPQHGSHAALDRSMVLLDQLLIYLDWWILKKRLTIINDRLECSEIGTAFVDGHRRGHAILGDRFLKVTLGCILVPLDAQQKVNGVAVLVDGPI